MGSVTCDGGRLASGTYRLCGEATREIGILLRAQRRTGFQLFLPVARPEAVGQLLLLHCAVLHGRALHRVLALLVLINHPLHTPHADFFGISWRLVVLPDMCIAAVGEQRRGGYRRGVRGVGGFRAWLSLRRCIYCLHGLRCLACLACRNIVLRRSLAFEIVSEARVQLLDGIVFGGIPEPTHWSGVKRELRRGKNGSMERRRENSDRCQALAIIYSCAPLVVPSTPQSHRVASASVPPLDHDFQCVRPSSASEVEYQLIWLQPVRRSCRCASAVLRTCTTYPATKH